MTREPASASDLARCGRGLVAATTDLFLQPTGSIALAFSDGPDPVHGFEATRDEAMQAFARSWFGENQP